ncbi:MAG TPA: phosphopantothenoylcysteine decarboxylase [Caldithrix abyssi]|uniref:Phosphopantothenoylcysteine decarboxylase n=1 Tax=Caldithrix abyssi TaxID=187145 RepID=A0A7V5RNC1_CALAY|nr:phosphopantothenoylcysteine decarboxylase [Caldithrix abyssi]
MKILLGISSSIAAYRIPNLVSQLKKNGHEVKTIITNHSKAFVAPQALSVMSGHPCHTDEDEWYNRSGVLHIELARWCDVFLIAPLSANTLAKLAGGICDNLLTSAVRALKDRPLVLAPAMNTAMWDNPFTEEHLQKLAGVYDLHIIHPVSKVLADGEEGMGALAGDDAIMEALNQLG